MKLRRGVGRNVLLIGPWAVKVPALRSYYQGPIGSVWTFVSGWQANLSEWEHRKTPGVAGPRATLAGLISIYPRCAPYTGPVPSALNTGDGLRHDAQVQNLGYLHGALVYLDFDQRGSDYYLAGRRPPNDDPKP